MASILRDWAARSNQPSKWVRRHGLWFWDFHKDVEWDETTRELFGVTTKAEITNAKFFDHIHPDDRGKVQQAVHTSIERQCPYEVMYRIYREDDGTTRFLRSEGNAYYDSLSMPVRMMGTVIDVTPVIVEPPAVFIIENN
jgi:PAS domain S-box-containing protein